MPALKRIATAAEWLLLSPAALFFAALFARNLQPARYEPARTAERIVAWFAVRPRVGLGVLLGALPLTVLITGCGLLLHSWNDDVALREAARRTVAAIRMHLATVVVAAATLAAGAILAVVALHVLTD